MNWRAVIFVIIISGSLFAQQIHLKTRDIQAGPAPAAASTDNHQIVEFDHAPSVEDLDNLLATGVRVISVLPDNAVVVGSADGAVLARPGVLWIGRLDPADKLSPALGSGDPLTVIVEFHTDVTADEQEAIAAEEGVELQRPAVLAASHAITTAALATLQALAQHDEVAYIFPADPALLTDSGFSACAGMLTLAGPIAQYANLVHGWDLDADGVAHLGYFFGSLTTNVPAASVESEVVRALNEWSKYTNVAFAQGMSAAAARTVFVEFVSGAHGDAYPFDGDTILAHTFYPVPVNPESIAGDMHLNADEAWHVCSDIDIYSVALHEAGHAIGLGHTDNPGDVMYPYYRRGMSLSANDIGAAEALYGTLSASAAPVKAPAGAPSVPAALQLTTDATPPTVQTPTISMAGILSGGTAPFSVEWQTNHGYTGLASLANSAAAGTESWTTGAISLVDGTNTISVTALDSAHDSATETVTVSLAPPPAAAAPPAPIAVAITTPSSSVSTLNEPNASLAGTAAGGSGIAKVTWQTSTGGSGTATGTTHWLAPSVPLLKGTNTIVIRAYDSSGNSAWAAVVAVRDY